MLAKADAELIERVGPNSGLEILLDPEAFLECLSEHEFGKAFERADFDYLRYVPGDGCLAAYRLHAGDRHVDVYAKTIQGNDAAPDADSASTEARAPIRLAGPPPILVCVFPHDLRLRSITRLEERAARERLLGRILPGRPELVDADVEPLRYRPERRYVCRLCIDGQPQAVLKFYRKREFLSADQQARRFEARERLFPIARVGASERHRVVGFDWCPGEPLRDVLEAPKLAAAPVRSVGFALAELHHQDSTGLPALTRKKQLASTLRAVERLEHLLPSQGPRAHALFERVTGRLEGETSSACLHGDFYSKQILLEEDRITLLDLDSAGRGDPSVDLGLFLAHLQRDEALGVLPRGRAAEASALLLDGYADKTGEAPGDLAAQAAMSLLGLSTYPFRRRLDDWPAAIESLLSRTDEILRE
jgi:aminoglycoside phosphotransferase